MVQLRTGYLSDMGLIRKRNEDAYLVQLSREIKILAVADGMGGHQGGHIASRLALEIIDAYSFKKNTMQEDMEKAILEANEKIKSRAMADPGLEGMGTTLTLLGINERKGLVAHVGDSRCYLFREGRLERVTRDHSLVEEMVRQGKLTSEEAATHPQRNVVLQALGLEEKPEIEFYELQFKKGDILLLCTDGLTGLVGEEEISEMLIEQKDLQQMAQKMVEKANAQGGHDNITVVLCSFEEEQP